MFLVSFSQFSAKLANEKRKLRQVEIAPPPAAFKLPPPTSLKDKRQSSSSSSSRRSTSDVFRSTSMSNLKDKWPELPGLLI
jgi:hypothetical protein